MSFKGKSEQFYMCVCQQNVCKQCFGLMKSAQLTKTIAVCFAILIYQGGRSHAAHCPMCKKYGSVRQKITCDGSETVSFLPRTHFFKANPLFRISAINSEGCIDGPVSTNHSLRVPLMSHHCQPLSPQWEFQGRLC